MLQCGGIPILWLSCAAALAGPPATFVSRGPGGGGAFFAPSINPYVTDEVWVGSDMSDLFVSRDFGRSWITVDFRVLQGGNDPGRMLFTSDPLVRFALNDAVPMRSVDGGVTWTSIPHDVFSPWVDGLWADPGSTGRLLSCTYTTLRISTNAGATWKGAWTNSDQLIAGAFWDGPVIRVGTRAGVLVSTNGGASFAAPVMPGVSAGEELVSFAGATAGGTARLYCITWAAGDVYPGVQGSSYSSYRKLYRMDGGTGSWVVATNGIGANQLFALGLCRTNPAIVYAAGSDGAGQPSVVRSVDGGLSWTQVMRCAGNANVATGWSGDDPGAWTWKKWSFGECAMGFTVCDADPQRAVITDFGFVHVTTNGGTTWRQAYVWDAQENAAGAATPKTNVFTGCGLEDTSCWWLDWFDSNTVFAGFTDIRGMWSTNGGRSWMSPLSLPFNSTYTTARHPTNRAVYAAGSSVHDLYAWDTYCQDARLDVGTGAVLWSTNKGASWATFRNLGRAIVHVALDANRPDRLYAAMVHSASGGIFRTTNLGAGVSATWSKLAVPPRTQGHPYTVQVLNDGTIVATYSARIASGDFQPSAGVFVSTDDGASWLDRTDAAMQYYTKDLTVDPHDPLERIWYAGVWGEWGSSANKGGLYRTTNRGIAWTRITTNLKAVGSCTIDPVSTNEMYVTTEDQGLWFTTNRLAAAPVFEACAGYPFRFPSRVFFNPHDANEVWVTSFGNGLRLGRKVEPAPVVHALSVDPGVLAMAVAHGQRVVTSASQDLVTWQEVATNLVFMDDVAVAVEVSEVTRFYRSAVPP